MILSESERNRIRKLHTPKTKIQGLVKEEYKKDLISEGKVCHFNVDGSDTCGRGEKCTPVTRDIGIAQWTEWECASASYGSDIPYELETAKDNNPKPVKHWGFDFRESDENLRDFY